MLSLGDCFRNYHANIAKLDFTRYKYRIKELYYSLPAKEKTLAMAEDCQSMGITIQHLRKLWGYEHGDENEAKPSQLAVIAGRFSCTIDELINEPARQNGHASTRA